VGHATLITAPGINLHQSLSLMLRPHGIQPVPGNQKIP